MEDIIVREMEPYKEKSVKDLFQRVYKDPFFKTAPVLDGAVDSHYRDPIYRDRRKLQRWQDKAFLI